MNQEILDKLSNMINNSKNCKNHDNPTDSEFFNYSKNNFFSNGNNKKNQNDAFDFSNIDMETIMKIKKIMNKMNENQSSPRSNLLHSLKPYLKDSKKEKIDQYIQLMNMVSIFEDLNFSSGKQ